MAKRQKMIAHIKYHYKKKKGDTTIEMDVDLSRFNKQYGKAQWELDNQIMTNMIPFMPTQTGLFVNMTRAMSSVIAGSGKVYAAAPPFGRFLYEGKTMVDEATGSPWARPGARKVLVSQYSGLTAARENLDYSKAAHPGVTDHWFDAAKKAYGKKWVLKARQTAGGG